MAPNSRPIAAHPLSPHLQIYRWTWTMLMSVLHRITGSALYGGVALVAIWLVALASGPRAYDAVSWLFGSWLGLIVLFAFSWILLHHMLGGLRHFVWDAGYGFETHERMRLARFTLIGSASLTLVVWVLVLILA